MKLSKQQIKQHENAVKILQKDKLTFDEKLQVYRDWIPAYEENIGVIASYFTPYEMAKELCVEIVGSRIIDLCAGIGMLGFTYYHWQNQFDTEIVCVERNHKFVEVGKKLFPEATWICGDVLDTTLYDGLPTFDTVISNPPFGKIKSTHTHEMDYKGSEFEYKVIEIGNILARYGAFIIPQLSCPFQYSGKRSVEFGQSEKYKKFNKETGLDLEMNCGIDLSIYKDDWVGTSIVCEIACIEYPTIESTMPPPSISANSELNNPNPQLALFAS
ncbi:methyltransferase [Sphingobacterium sp. UBA6645]|uniref:methyltransferase n=1 Tax=Sphingobacterium sp. UBA6645 TaxID=1947511 RepID=UPI0025E9CF18|nr:methyltransferase [Sphingobacterium sp. UBA6645]